MGWVKTYAGTMQFSELLTEFKIPYLEEEQLNQVREERLAIVLAAEIEENEPVWTDYEYEETQTKLDIGDMILEALTEETMSLAWKLEDRFNPEAPQDPMAHLRVSEVSPEEAPNSEA